MEQIKRRDFPANKYGVAEECEGVCHGYDIGPSPVLSPNAMGVSDADRDRVMALHLQAAAMEILVDLAGSYAEARYRRRSYVAVQLSGGYSDYKKYTRTLETWFPNDKAKISRMANSQVRSLIRSTPGWNAIETMAALLYETGEIDGPKVDEACTAAYGVNRHPGLAAVMDNWPIDPAAIRRGLLPGST